MDDSNDSDRTRWPVLLAVAVLVMASAGCDVAEAGKDGNLQFELDSDDRIIPARFDTPLAAEQRVDLRVYDADSGAAKTPAAVRAAELDDPGVAGIVGTAANRVTVEGRRTGVTELTVETPAGRDRIDIEVAEIATVTLTNPGVLLTPEQDPVTILQGGLARYFVATKDAGGRLLIGYGDFPIAMEPAEAGVQVPTNDVAHVTFRFDSGGPVTLRPLGAPEKTANVITVADLVGLSLEAQGTRAPGDLIRGQTALAILRAEDAVGNTVVGLSGVATVETATPTICLVEETPILGDGVFELESLSAGTCTLDAALGTLRAALTLQVIEPTTR